MSLLNIISLALVVALTRAGPILNNPSRVLRRDAPAPSAYPLDSACGNEWQYLNFNTTVATDRVHLQTLHDVICGGEMRAISSYGQISAQNVNTPYKRYFPESDDEDDYPTNVKDVLGLIAGASSTDGAIGTVVGTFVVDNLGKLLQLRFPISSDFDSLWQSPLTPSIDFAANVPGASDCTVEGTLAYTLEDQVDDLEKIHFCDLSWTRGEASDVDCASLDPFPSTKMDSFSRIALHEMMHYSSIGPNTPVGETIGDCKNRDSEPANDPPRVHGLLDPNQDDNPAVTEINADSYAWMSLDAWMSQNCIAGSDTNNWASFFTQNPPPYNE